MLYLWICFGFFHLCDNVFGMIFEYLMHVGTCLIIYVNVALDKKRLFVCVGLDFTFRLRTRSQ